MLWILVSWPSQDPYPVFLSQLRNLPSRQPQELHSLGSNHHSQTPLLLRFLSNFSWAQETSLNPHPFLPPAAHQCPLAGSGCFWSPPNGNMGNKMCPRWAQDPARRSSYRTKHHLEGGAFCTLSRTVAAPGIQAHPPWILQSTEEQKRLSIHGAHLKRLEDWKPYFRIFFQWIFEKYYCKARKTKECTLKLFWII